MVDWIDRHFALGFKLHNYLPMNDAKYLFYQFNWFRNFSFIHTHTHTHTQHIHVTDDTHIVFISVQFSCQSCTMFETPWTAACQVSLSITNSRTLLKLVSIELVMPSVYLILCRPLLLLPSIFPSIRVLSNESVLCIRRPKYWSSSFSISPSNEYSGLITFRKDWLDLLPVQDTPKSIL